MSSTAKVFWSGRSQAVRLPKEFRVEADEVRIRWQGEAIVLEPVARDWSWLATVQAGELDDDFVKVAEEGMPDQDRIALDFFK